MTTHNLKRLACVAMAAVASLMGATAPAPATAQSLNDPQVLQIKAAMIQAMINGNSAQAAAQAQQDAAARTSAECAAVQAEAQRSAEAKVIRNTPPDPTKVIQNTTCYVDVATVQIPVILTGIPFIDTIIQQYLQRFLTGQCNRSLNFFGTLQNTALAQLRSGGGSLVLNYAQTGLPNLGALQNAGAANIPPGSTVPPPNTNSAINGVNDMFNNLQNTWAGSSAMLMCSLGIADATYCPNCLDNPTHANCMGPRPVCDPVNRPDLVAPYCEGGIFNGGGGS